jgi:uncharacterized protein (DUF4415 family)
VSNKGLSKKSLTDWARVDALGDNDRDYHDIPAAAEDFWRQAKLVLPAKKKLISIRLDEDVVAWFKQQGRPYQTLINSVLKAYVEHQKQARGDQE